MEKKIRGNTLAYWEANANEDYKQTPISVLKYITILEEELKVKNNVAKRDVKYCSLCGAIYEPHEHNPNDAICKDCSRNLRGY